MSMITFNNNTFLKLLDFTPIQTFDHTGNNLNFIKILLRFAACMLYQPY